MKTNTHTIPKTGIQGLKENWKIDVVSGFLVFLLALPLSLGIAKASGFPAAMGVLTAIVGGLMSSFFNVSQLSIKGPAAGLITISAAAVAEFGGDVAGWQIVCGIIVVMALFQILFGVLKFGSFSAFFPHAVIHGMLAAIGLIIIAKQIPVLLGNEASLFKGESPFELFLDIPKFVLHAHWHIAATGILGLILMFLLPQIKGLKKIPAPMVVLVLTIPLAIYWHFKTTEPTYSLVQIGDFWGAIQMNADFSKIAEFSFWKYVAMFLFVGSLESLLTVKAVDNLDPFHRKANPNGDLIGQGSSNVVAGLLGGLPMISEVVRSAANIGFGARSKLSNFFHGMFLLIAMLLMIPLIEMIPNAALAAMLIYAGYRLASPFEFIHMFKIGKGQLIIFLVTIFFTLFEDLLVGIAAGIIAKIIIHLINGAQIQNMFKAKVIKTENDGKVILKVQNSATFANLIGYRNLLDKYNKKTTIDLDFSEAKLIDHSFMEFITKYKQDYESEGFKLELIGYDTHISFSAHHLAARAKTKVSI